MVILISILFIPWKRELLNFFLRQFQYCLLEKRLIFKSFTFISIHLCFKDMFVMAWLPGCCIVVCFMLVIYFTKIILDYLDSKPSGRRTLMDELNRVSLYSFLLIILSNYPFTIVLIFGPDLSHCKYIAEYLSIIR